METYVRIQSGYKVRFFDFVHMKSKNYQKLILNLLGTKPIAFNPLLSEVLGSVTASLFLSQLLFWWGKGRNPEMIYKTVKELEEETTLTKAEQLSSQKICVKLGILSVVYKGIPPKRNYIIKLEVLIELLRKHQDTKHSNSGKRDNHSSGEDAYITEITTKKNKSEISFEQHDGKNHEMKGMSQLLNGRIQKFRTDKKSINRLV